MNTGLTRALRSAHNTVPVPWPTLAEIITPRPGGHTVIAAAPGRGKSTLALVWAMEIAPEPVLYVSIDTSMRDQAIRVASRLSGHPVAAIEDDLPFFSNWLDEQPMLNVRFVDDARDFEELGEIVEAECEFWGEPPRLTIVDNIGDMVTDESSAEYNSAFRELGRIAKRHDTHVLALHHLNRGPAADGDKSPTMRSLNYAGERKAEAILGLWSPDGSSEKMNVSVIKNRMGPANPTGKLFSALDLDLTRVQITDPASELLLTGVSA